MKTTTTLKAATILSIMSGALALASCSSDETASDGMMELRLSSGLTVQDDTRAKTTIQSTAFESGENIDVYIFENATNATTEYGTNGKLVYTADGSNGMKTYDTSNAEVKQYWPSSGNGVNIYAYYPSGKVANAMSTDDEKFTVATDQSSETNYKASDLMYGTPTSNPVVRTSKAVNVKFQHLLSKVNIILQLGSGMNVNLLEKADVQLIKVLPETTLTPSRGIVGTASGTAQNITVITDGEVETVEDKSVVTGSCIVPPQELAEEFVLVTLETGGELYGKLPDNAKPTLEGGKVYTYTITVNLTGLELTGSIEDWGTGASKDGEATMKDVSGN